MVLKRRWKEYNWICLEDHSHIYLHKRKIYHNNLFFLKTIRHTCVCCYSLPDSYDIRVHGSNVVEICRWVMSSKIYVCEKGDAFDIIEKDQASDRMDQIMY